MENGRYLVLWVGSLKRKQTARRNPKMEMTGMESAVTAKEYLWNLEHKMKSLMGNLMLLKKNLKKKGDWVK